MEKSISNCHTTIMRQLPRHACHPNPSLLKRRKPYIAYPK